MTSQFERSFLLQKGWVKINGCWCYPNNDYTVRISYLLCSSTRLVCIYNLESITGTKQSERRKLYTFIDKAQEVNEKLTQTNSQFVEVLNTYKSDLEDIKSDVTVIKNNMKG